MGNPFGLYTPPPAAGFSPFGGSGLLAPAGMAPPTTGMNLASALGMGANPGMGWPAIPPEIGMAGGASGAGSWMSPQFLASLGGESAPAAEGLLGGLGAGAAPVASGIGRFGASALAGAGGGALESGGGGLLSTLGSWFPQGFGKIGGGVGGLKAGLGAALPMGLVGGGLGYLGGKISASNPDHPGLDWGDAGQFLTGAGAGLGVGGPLALALGATGPVGWGIGGALAVGAGLGNAIWGHSGSDQTSKLEAAQNSLNASLIKLHAIDPTTATALRSQIDTMYPLATSDAQKLQLIQSAAQNVAANFGISTSRTGAYSNATDLLNAVQTYQGQHADASAAKYNQDEAARAAYMNQMVGQMKPAQQAYGHYMVSQQLEQAQQALLAQQQQAQAMPYMLALQMQQQIGQQYAPYGVTPTQPTTSGTGAGTTGINLASLLQPQPVPAA